MNDYPTTETLSKIEHWRVDTQDDCHALMKFVKDFWCEVGSWHEYEIEGKTTYSLVTGGWSGNEDIIYAMMENDIFWSLFWEQSHRGGLYVFSWA